MSKTKTTGFTIVELLIVVVVIAILAAVAVVAYVSIRQRAVVSTMSSDLRSAAGALELYKVDNGGYPAGLPPNTKTSSGVVLSTTNTAADAFCINAYYQSDPSLKLSWNSSSGLQNGNLCSGAAIGGSIGGSVPMAARGTNIMPEFTQWTLSGTATYNPTTTEMTLGTNGTARSPLVRVDQPNTIRTGGDLYATVASANPTLAPQGGFHVSISYFGSDGITPALNSTGHIGNGCARALTLNAWQSGLSNCVFNGGPNIAYAMYSFIGPAGGYTSSDLKIKVPLLILSD